MNESEMLAMIESSSRTLLVEPPYKRKYPPLGLAKIATYQQRRGANVEFSRNVIPGDFDLVCMTSLFTSDSDKVIDQAQMAEFILPGVPVLIGGVYASLMEKHLQNAAPAAAIFAGYSPKLDLCVPDYSINWEIEEPWDRFAFLFTTRGCPNRCAYCAVWRLEPETWICPNWRDHIPDDKPYVIISDNNLSAAPLGHIRELIDFLVERKKRVVFDNGLDCKLITEEIAAELARLRYTRHGMRLAFDRIEEDGVFQAAVRRLLDAGVPKSQIMAYVLFNFKDSPQEADYRMRECANLGIRPYPQQYQPLNRKSRTEPAYVGRQWTLRLVRAFRGFWLMAGIYGKQEFAEWLEKNRDGELNTNLKLGPEDWAAWSEGS